MDDFRILRQCRKIGRLSVLRQIVTGIVVVAMTLGVSIFSQLDGVSPAGATASVPAHCGTLTYIFPNTGAVSPSFYDSNQGTSNHCASTYVGNSSLNMDYIGREQVITDFGIFITYGSQGWVWDNLNVPFQNLGSNINQGYDDVQSGGLAQATIAY